MTLHTMRSYFYAAGHDVDVTTFARNNLMAQKQAVLHQLQSVGHVPADLAALLDVELGDPLVPVGDPVYAYVNHGNWLAKCECGGCEFVDDQSPLYMCCSCWNKANGYRWRRVVMPAQRASIERLLLNRPNDENRNWKSDENVEDLRRENREHGVADGVE